MVGEVRYRYARQTTVRCRSRNPRGRRTRSHVVRLRFMDHAAVSDLSWHVGKGGPESDPEDARETSRFWLTGLKVAENGSRTNERLKYGIGGFFEKQGSQGVGGTTFRFVVLRTKTTAIFLAGVVDTLEQLHTPNDHANHALNGQTGTVIKDQKL
jgi:hypothetical protein